MPKRIIIMISKKNKVVLGLSGGVDSTAAALLLLEKGYEVTGLYFDVTAQAAALGEGRKKAERAAKELGIDFVYRDVADSFERVVIDDFCCAYAAGKTPNPCIVCNPSVKFRTLIEAADDLGAGYIATGHYASVRFDEASGKWYVAAAANVRKDQSYMLYRLDQETISRLLLPLSDMEDKTQVRELARARAMGNSEAKDSQEICFIDDDEDYKEFLRRRGVDSKKGHFVDAEGRVLGDHDGILSYTIGQRKGLGIALGKPAFVVDIDGESGNVQLGDNEDLFSREIYSENNVIVDEALLTGDNVTAKIRYAARPAAVKAQIADGGRIRAVFDEPQRAATPGQSIVFYSGGLVVGGGFIVKADR